MPVIGVEDVSIKPDGRNMLIVGGVGQGKTSFLRGLVMNTSQSEALVHVISRHGEYRDCVSFASITEHKENHNVRGVIKTIDKIVAKQNPDSKPAFILIDDVAPSQELLDYLLREVLPMTRAINVTVVVAAGMDAVDEILAHPGRQLFSRVAAFGCERGGEVASDVAKLFVVRDKADVANALHRLPRQTVLFQEFDYAGGWSMPRMVRVEVSLAPVSV